MDSEVIKSVNCKVVNTYNWGFLRRLKQQKQIKYSTNDYMNDEFLFCVSEVIAMLDIIILGEINITEDQRNLRL